MMPDPFAGGEPAFAAFLSYSHADEAVARKLQRELETYRLPSNVARTRGDKQAGERRIGRIFRDRADFAAASSLTDAIRNALAQSRALIVLCSPDARASEWVAAEIRLFRELHPTAPVLAMLLRGEPVEAMPAQLLADGGEPLAADLRPGGDGWKLAFLKLVAALVGTPLDALIQRDAQRRLRRVTFVTVIASVVAIAMMAMTALAISARNEARAQRAQAEGLVDYMLTDLRTKLRGVGNLSVMSAVNDRAMDYYRSQGDLSALPAESLERRAAILHAMGEDDLARNMMRPALQRFTEAHRTTAALLSAAPDDPDRLFIHAQSEYWLGAYYNNANYYSRDEQYSRAKQHFDAYRSLAGRLMAVAPNDTRSLREIGYAEGNLCSVAYLRMPITADAVGHCRAALTAMDQLLARDPDSNELLMAVANRRSWLASALSDTGQHERASAESAASQTATQQLAARDPDNADYQDMIVASLISTTRINMRAGNRSTARHKLSEARALLVTLRGRDPTNARWLRLDRQVDDLLAELTNSQPS
jgi:tetratricopeptide (TPR) repeat protein